MKITLVGNGRMGRQIADVVAASGAHVVNRVLDVNDTIDAAAFSGSDVIIDFTVRSAFLANYPALIASGVPVVVGTTGWDDVMPQVREEVVKARSTMLYSANYSLGVNIFFRTLREAARLIAPFEQFDIALSEQHHTGKADFPSGTAIKAADEILNSNPRKRTIVRELQEGRKLQSDELQVASIRLGSVFGVHSAIIDSESDTIELTHTAKNRTGFASGAVRAAEWLVQRHATSPGFYTMDDFLNDLFLPEMVVETVPGRPSKVSALLGGAVLLVLTTTLPYLTLINAFLFAGIIIAGAVAAWYYIMRNQIRLEPGEAFVLGAMSGFIGGALSVLVAYLLEKWFGYIPGLESLRLLVAWATSLAPENAETFQQMLAMVTAPKDIALSDLLVSMILTGMFYAPFAGLGGRVTVFFLKRQARKR